MELFSTIVFIDGNPVGYKVHQDQAGQLSLNPAENPARSIMPPTLKATRVDGSWKIEGTENKKIIEQVLQDLRQNYRLPQHQLSAAP
jgi:hypothetical protein